MLNWFCSASILHAGSLSVWILWSLWESFIYRVANTQISPSVVFLDLWQRCRRFAPGCLQRSDSCPPRSRGTGALGWCRWLGPRLPRINQLLDRVKQVFSHLFPGTSLSWRGLSTIGECLLPVCLSCSLCCTLFTILSSATTQWMRVYEGSK